MPKQFPKTYLPEKYEEKIYHQWKKSGYFNPDNLKLSKKAKKYSIVMPPANVTGTLHMGHATMLAIEDILIRYHRMNGQRTLWLPGTDHAAIATQNKVEKILKEEGQTRHTLGQKKFLKKVVKFAKNSHNTIKNQIEKMGSSCDWSREAYTLDATRHKTVNSVFKIMFDDGLIYQGERIVNWCPRCHSTLADDEVEYQNQKAKLYTFRYDKNFPIEISTTRPETKLGDTAVAVNPSDKRYKKFIGKEYLINFCDLELKIKIIADQSIDMNFGTGAVGITPAHSLVDWQLAEKHHLPIKKIINEEGIIRADLKKFGGISVLEAREKIVAELKEKKLLSQEEDLKNNLSICYRCGETIEPLPSQQWFIDVNKKIPHYKKSLKQLSLEAIKKGVFNRKKINIYPRRFEKIYLHWMENLRDWCISRQIWFGHQIPVWYKKNKKTLKGKIYIGIKPPKEKGWRQDANTLDTWFSSGLWTFSALARKPEQIKIKNGQLIIDSTDFKNFHPTDVLETGYDIIFFWVARMILMTTYAIGDIPFQNVYLHGLVLDEKGKKMSKSRGNTLDPLKMCQKYGTDATRLSLIIGATPGNDIKVSPEKIEGQRNLINKLWNISRYILTNYKLENKNYKIYYKNLTLADTWILEKMRNLITEIGNDLEKYNFSSAAEKLRNFTWNDLADWYIEASKFEKSKKEKTTILNMILEDLLKLWHPFIPFITEKIWESINGKKMLMIEQWPKINHYKEIVSLNDINLINFEYSIKEIIKTIRNARAEYQIPPKKKISVTIYSKKYFSLIQNQENLIKNLRTGIENLKVSKSGPEISKAFYASLPNMEIFIPLGGVIDLDKEEKRLKKEWDQAKKFIASLESKICNQDFIKNAPKEIVKKEKEKLTWQKNKIMELKKQLTYIK